LTEVPLRIVPLQTFPTGPQNLSTTCSVFSLILKQLYAQIEVAFLWSYPRFVAFLREPGCQQQASTSAMLRKTCVSSTLQYFIYVFKALTGACNVCYWQNVDNMIKPAEFACQCEKSREAGQHKISIVETIPQSRSQWPA
jgi:hypothetical protein